MSQQTLYWDTARLFTLFRDPLHSLNRYSEIAWWFPQNQEGMPSFYFLVLNTASSSSPLMAVVGLFVWGLGRLGIFIERFQPLYVFYFGFLTPLLFLVSLSWLLRILFRNSLTRAFALTAAAFSPGILFNLSDIGFLEPLSYGIAFAAAWLAFLFNPKEITFRVLGAMFCLLALTVNNATFYWNIVALPCFVLAVGFLPWKTARPRFQVAVRSFPIRRWAVFLGLAAICALPQFVAFFLGRDLINPALGGRRWYHFSELAGGNPLEFISTSLAGFGFDWEKGRRAFSLLPLGTDHHSANYYLGLSAIPLALMGLLYGRRSIRLPLFAISLVSFAVVPLSAYSPLFAALLVWETPLRICNHFSDVGFKAGGFLIVILAMTLGWEAWRKNPKLTPIFAWLVALMVVANMAFHFSLNPQAGSSKFLGLVLVMAFFYFVVIFRAPSRWAFLTLLFIELSTHAFLSVRLWHESTYRLDSGWKAMAVITETPAPSGVGMFESTHPHYYANRFLMQRERFDLLSKNQPLASGPKAGLFSDVTTSSPIAGTVTLSSHSYNHWMFDIESSQAGVFYLRDSDSPYWTAWVNGRETPITRARSLYKSVFIPQGRSRVTFRFSPPYLGASLAFAYAVFLAALGFALSSKLQVGQHRGVIRRLLTFSFVRVYPTSATRSRD